MDSLPPGFEMEMVERVVEMKKTGALNVTLADFPNFSHANFTFVNEVGSIDEGLSTLNNND